MDDFSKFVTDNIWIIAVTAVVIILLVIILVWLACKYRYYRRFDYTALQEHLSLPERMAMEKKVEQETVQTNAFMNLQFYLRSNNKYRLLVQLPRIGSRKDKCWFVVREPAVKHDLLMSMARLHPTSDCQLHTNSKTKATLNDLFSILKHPYILDVHAIDFFLAGGDQELVVVLQRYCVTGSLKDLIYSNSNIQQEESSKYRRRGKPLPLQLIQTCCRQILEALLFLEEKGFPPFGHLHSGNVIYYKSACRLSGLENCLVGLAPKLSPLVSKLLAGAKKEAIDSVAFGHLLFEMSAGFELDTAKPSPRHLVHVKDHQIIRVLNTIFDRSSSPHEGETGSDRRQHDFPTIREISELPFFQNVALKELAKHNPAPIFMTDDIKTLLKGGSLKMKRKPTLSRGKSIRSGRSHTIQSSTSTSETSFSRPINIQEPNISSGSRRSTRSFSVDVPSDLPSPPPTPSSAPHTDNGREVGEASERTGLLTDIRRGKPLKSTETDDRSAPKF